MNHTNEYRARTNEYRAKALELLSLAETMNDAERRAGGLRKCG
jgi:hypothetical protein